jgi:5-methylcytosine-specific restriction protein A
VPSRAMKFCGWPGCNKLTQERFCDTHQAEHDLQLQQADRNYNRQRGSAKSRGYDSQWEKVRALKLRLNPLCEKCESLCMIVPADMVHHIKAIKDGGAKYDLNNLKSLCNACHEVIEGPNRWKKRETGDW